MTDIIDTINRRGFARREEWPYARDAWAARQWKAALAQWDRESGRRALRMGERRAWRKLKVAVLRQYPWLRRLLQQARAS